MTGPFQGPAKGIYFTPDNKHFYGYNYFSIDGAVQYFNFSTTSYYLVAKMIGGRNMKSGGECTIEVTFNDGTVFKTKWDNGTSGTNNNPMASETPFVIPPFTNVKIDLSTDAQDEISLGIMGEVHGSVDQTDLEV
jgi:hypothetical protein